MIVDPKDQKSPLSHYLFKAEAIKRFFDVAEKGITLLNSYFIISSLSVFSFGLYQLILSFISIVRGLGVNFFDGMVTLDMRRYFNVQKRDLAKKLFQENIFFKIAAGIIMAIAVFLGADIIANLYGQQIASLLKWSSILLVTSAFQSLAGIFLQSVISFSQRGFSALREILKLGLIIFFLSFYQFTISEVIIAHVIAETITTIALSLFVFIKKYPQAFRGVTASIQPLMVPMVKTHGRYVFVSFGLKEVLQDSAPWLVKFFLNTESVALYSLAVNLTSFIQDFMPLTGLRPILALKADNLKELAFVFTRTVKYMLWLGILFLVVSFFAVPPTIGLLFPNYLPAIPAFLAMSLSFPLYGVMKAIAIVLASLREYKTLAMRLFNEVLILFGGSALLLPTVGVVGVGLVYLARLIERTWFLYYKLVKSRPEFRVKLKNLFVFDKTDKQFIRSFLSFVYRKRA